MCAAAAMKKHTCMPCDCGCQARCGKASGSMVLSCQSCSSGHLLAPPVHSAVQRVWPVVGDQLVGFAVQLELRHGDAIGAPPHHHPEVRIAAVLRNPAGRRNASCSRGLYCISNTVWTSRGLYMSRGASREERGCRPSRPPPLPGKLPTRCCTKQEPAELQRRGAVEQ